MNTYTSNLKLPIPAVGDQSWNVANDARATILDGLKPASALMVTTHEQPSASLLVDVAAGSFLKQDWSVNAYAGAMSVAVTTAATNYIWLTPAGVLTQNTTGFPSTAAIPLAIVVAGATTITSIADARNCFPVVGPLLDGTTWALGTSSGLQIGTATGQKLAFFGATPVVQQTLGVKTAGGTYGTNEQGMLQAVYNLARAFGLGS